MKKIDWPNQYFKETVRQISSILIVFSSHIFVLGKQNCHQHWHHVYAILWEYSLWWKTFFLLFCTVQMSQKLAVKLALLKTHEYPTFSQNMASTRSFHFFYHSKFLKKRLQNHATRKIKLIWHIFENGQAGCLFFVFFTVHTFFEEWQTKQRDLKRHDWHDDGFWLKVSQVYVQFNLAIQGYKTSQKRKAKKFAILVKRFLVAGTCSFYNLVFFKINIRYAAELLSAKAYPQW